MLTQCFLVSDLRAYERQSLARSKDIVSRIVVESNRTSARKNGSRANLHVSSATDAQAAHRADAIGAAFDPSRSTTVPKTCTAIAHAEASQAIRSARDIVASYDCVGYKADALYFFGRVTTSISAPAAASSHFTTH